MPEIVILIKQPSKIIPRGQYWVFMKSTLKVMPSIVLYCPMMSEVDVCGMPVEFEPSCQYSTTFCCYMTDNSTGLVWKNGVRHGSMYEKGVKLNSSMWKKKLNSLTFSDACRMFMLTEDSSTMRRCVLHFSNDTIIAAVTQWVISSGADSYECSMQALVRCWWKCIPNGSDYVEK